MTNVMLLLFLVCFAPICAGEEYYVTPTPPPNPACPPGKPCETLRVYAQDYAFDNETIELLFLDGTYEASIALTIRNVQYLRLVSADNSLAECPQVKSMNATFMSIDILKIEDLSIIKSTIQTTDLHHCEIQDTHVKNIFLVLRIGVVFIENSIINKSRIQILTGHYLEVSNSSFFSSETRFGNFARRLTVAISNSTYYQQGLELCVKTLIAWKVSFLGSDVNETTLSLKGPMNATLDNCIFDNNKVTLSTLQAVDVNLFLRGSIMFSNNTAYNGGAIYMTRSLMWLQGNVQISFINNKASHVGGAIFVVGAERLLRDGLTQCFYKFDSTSLQHRISLMFRENSAGFGGDNIYGSGVKGDCYVSDTNIGCDVQDIFDFQTPSLSTVSSNPKRICLCSNAGIPQCNNITFVYYKMSVIPGGRFELSAVVVGNDFGTVTGSVYASSVRNKHSNFAFAPGQDSQQIGTNKQCSSLAYSIHLTAKYVREIVFMLSIDSIVAASQRALLNTDYSEENLIDYRLETCIPGDPIMSTTPYWLNTPIIIEANVLPCPGGFELLLTTDRHYICQCDNLIMDYVYNCIITNGQSNHYRNGTTWIGSDQRNKSETILAHRFCPFDYCKPESLAIDLQQPDSQCALNHSGVLCGGCQPGLSLAIGSSRCIPCPNSNNAALFLVFIAAGIVLIAFIKVFDLTVAHGTINALIFYANAIWIYAAIFFSGLREQIDGNLLNYYVFLKAFVAWLNLDFGIETCFVQGLDAYWKTWLQFVFPFYIWILAGLIVVACHYSTRATKLFGNNTVPVLATVFLLSYAKLLRTIVLALGPAVLQQYHPEGTRWVWLLDGNVPYLGVQHAFLFIMALLVLFFLWLPYTLTLLLIQPIKKLPCACVLRQIVKFKPLLDTYTGPFKSKHQYWIGLTLLVRVVLAVTAVTFQAINPIVNIDILLLVSGLLSFGVIHVFKKQSITLLELSFLFNLIMLCITYLSSNDAETRLICTCVSVSVSLLTFVGTTVSHVFTNQKMLPSSKVPYCKTQPA